MNEKWPWTDIDGLVRDKLIGSFVENSFANRLEGDENN